MNKQIIEVYDFTKNDITVRVEIDHKNNKISLLELDYDCVYHIRGDSRYKKWVFAERGVEYMQGWLNILEVMQEAIKDAKTRYDIRRIQSIT